MSDASAELALAHRRATRPIAIPWLLSTTLHTLTFIGLALLWPMTTITTTQAPGAVGVSIEATLLSSLSSMGRDDSGVSGRFDTPPADGYFDDEPTAAGGQFAAEQPAESAVAVSATGGPSSLNALLNEQPAVEMAGVLPVSPGAQPGIGGTESGVRSATGLTGEPPPPRRMKGGSALTGVFGLKGEGHKFVYVFDRSGSMDGHGGAPLIAAKNELINSLRDLGQTHQFQIIFYNEEPRIFNPSGQSGRLVFGTDQNKNLARRFVGSVTASGATRHVEALELALRLGPDVIFFLTDADEPRMTPKELAHIAQMNHGTAINTIEFGTDPRAEHDNFISRLARQNGGQHVYIDVTRLSSNRR